MITIAPNTIALAAAGLLLAAPVALAIPPSPDSRPAVTAERLPAPAMRRLAYALCQLGGIYQVRCLSYSGRPANGALAFDNARPCRAD